MTDETLLPLNERINAPADLPVVSAPGLQARAATLDDVDAMTTLAHAMDAVDHPTWQTPRAEVEDLINNPLVVPAEDTVVLETPDGTIVGYAATYPAAAAIGQVQVYVFGGVHPDYRDRGLGTQLIEWGRDRALQRLAQRDEALPAWIQVYALQSNTAAIGAAQAAGFVVNRYFHEMERIVADEIPEVDLPAGIELRTFTLDDTERTREARNDSFRDHWGSQPSQPDRWQKFVTGEIFRPDLSVIAVEPGTGRVVAFTLASVNEDDTPLQGYRSAYIELVGVIRDFRGQRLAPATIAEHLRRARADGIERVTLGVDTTSLTGANTLYERLGFTVKDVEVGLVIEL